MADTPDNAAKRTGREGAHGASAPGEGLEIQDSPPTKDLPSLETTTSSTLNVRREGGSGAPEVFAPEVILANRYRIHRFVARGGMGEVYEVEDLALGGLVALKTIRSEAALNPRAADRFKREIHLSRRVSHPNVCRIHDLGTHRLRDASGLERDVLFLTMEMLQGSTLARHVMESGSLSPGEALSIAAQMGAGLDAAHAVGVIHRDFKSSNVMLAPSGEGTRACITDFGLARRFATEDSLSSISESGQMAGTPAYMAPEQVQGLELTPAADVYAFGIVLYEMVTGRRPFDGGSAMAVALKRLTQDPAPPSRHAPGLPPAWDAVILRCLARDPTRRFPSAGAAVRAFTRARPDAGDDLWLRDDSPPLDGSPSPSSRKDQPSRLQSRIDRRFLAAAALALTATVAVLAWRAGSFARSDLLAPGAAISAGPSRPSLAVLELKNASALPEAAWLSTALSEMLGSDLGAGGRLRTLSGAEVARVRQEVGLPVDSDLDGDALGRFQKAAGADLVVAGSYTLIGATGARLLRIDVRLVDGRNGETRISGSATGAEVQLFDLVSRAGAPLRRELGLDDVSPTQALEVQASLPADTKVARLYSEGLALLREFDARGARVPLEEAVAADPRHPLPHAALADAWAQLGYDERAREEARKAQALAGALPREQQLAIEARRHELARDWNAAILAYRSLADAAPDDPEYRFRLADAQTEAGKGNEALVTLAGLRRAVPALAEDPRVDLAEARAWKGRAQFQKQRALAARAAEGASRRGARLLLARARLLEANALMAVGDAKGAVAATEEARGLYEAAGDRAGLARALVVLAIALNGTGDLDGARRLFQRAATISAELGDERTAAVALHNLGNVVFDQGRAAEAQRFYEQSLSRFRQIGARSETAATLNDLGARLQVAGDLEAARKRYQDALALFGEIGERSGVATTLTNLAELLALQGQLQQALEMHQEALALCREIGDKAGAAYSLERIAEVFADRGDERVADDRYREALALQKDLGDRIASAQVQVGLASVVVAQGRAGEGEGLVREAEEVLRAGQAEDGAARARVVLAQALLAGGRVEEAGQAAAAALESAAKSEDRRLRLAATLVAARVRGASGRPEDVAAARRAAEGALAEALRVGFRREQFDARLVLGALNLSAGGSAGRARLETLASEAETSGFRGIARRARELLSPRS